MKDLKVLSFFLIISVVLGSLEGHSEAVSAPVKTMRLEMFSGQRPAATKG